MRKHIITFLILLIAYSCVLKPISAKALSIEGIASETAVLINAENGQVIFDKNKDKQMYPASITKILTATIALEKLGMGDTLTTSRQAAALPYNSSHIALSPDEQINTEQALYALAVESANDAANVLAESISGTNEEFSVLMNELARQAGATNSNFANPHGLPDNNHYTTAYDMALITARAIQNQTFNSIFSTEKYEIPPTNKKDKTRQIWSSSYFLSGYVSCEGLIMTKTGWTEEAGHTLVTAATRNGITLIAVVMNSEKKKDKWDDTVALFDYGFNNYQEKIFTVEEISQFIPSTINLSGGGDALQVNPAGVTGSSIKALVPKSAPNVEFSVTYDEIKVSDNMDYIDVAASVILNPSSLATLAGKSNFKMFVSPLTTQEAITQKTDSFMHVVPSLLGDIMTTSLGVFLIWIAIRRYIIYKKRQKRNRERLMEKRAAMMGREMIDLAPVVSKSDIPTQGNRKRQLTAQQLKKRQMDRRGSQMHKR